MNIDVKTPLQTYFNSKHTITHNINVHSILIRALWYFRAPRYFHLFHVLKLSWICHSFITQRYHIQQLLQCIWYKFFSPTVLWYESEFWGVVPEVIGDGLGQPRLGMLIFRLWKKANRYSRIHYWTALTVIIMTVLIWSIYVPPLGDDVSFSEQFQVRGEYDYYNFC